MFLLGYFGKFIWIIQTICQWNVFLRKSNWVKFSIKTHYGTNNSGSRLNCLPEPRPKLCKTILNYEQNYTENKTKIILFYFLYFFYFHLLHASFSKINFNIFGNFFFLVSIFFSIDFQIRGIENSFDTVDILRPLQFTNFI